MSSFSSSNLAYAPLLPALLEDVEGMADIAAGRSRPFPVYPAKVKGRQQEFEMRNEVELWDRREATKL